ncbi:MAG: hypothetical protein BWY14_00153 [Parcubacteria group bacterium ADurb.Bin192]|nr:MAG: hypothetical protein BWY14_00153 [Parcubacteria group bacterium ADurb.Bin192]
MNAARALAQAGHGELEAKIYSRLFEGYCYINLFLLNANPDPDLRYFSKSSANFLDEKPAYQISFHGPPREVVMHSPR